MNVFYFRTPQDGWLNSGTAWSARDSDLNQYLQLDLGQVMNVTTITTKGRSHTSDYVSEFMIQYGTNGRDFSDYKEVDGSPKLFDANNDGFHEARNKFDQPIIARYVRINPTRWADKIAMRVEMYGCEYIADKIYFDGKSMLRRELKKHPISSRRDVIRFRFKTNDENGVLLYAKGTQEDYFALQLVENRLLLNINLGARRTGMTGAQNQETSLTLGSLLDNNIFHEVMISRNRRDIVLSVDRVRIKDRIQGEFNKLDLDGFLYIGGVPYVQRGLVIYENFTGCIENLYLNHTNVIAAYRDRIGNPYETEVYQYDTIGSVSPGQCTRSQWTIPVTFRTENSHVRLQGYEGTYSFNITLEFRTFEEDGLIIFHQFSSEGYVKLFMENARLKVEITSNDVPKVIIDNFDQSFNDGNWHQVELSMEKNKAVLSIDKVRMLTHRILEIRTGAHYLIGGGLYGQRGFIGCMRRIVIDGQYKPPTSWKLGDEIMDEDVIIDSCQMTDRCNPNPCEHGGICKQNSKDFFCECEGTGYTGAVCHTSLNWFSCVQFQNKHPESRYEETIIDIDGSGPIPPVPVRCEFFPDGRNITYIEHDSLRSVKVDGFDGKGEYEKVIQYYAPYEMMEAMINRSKTCLQKLGYNCKRSRLLNTPVSESQIFDPFGWWVSRQNKKMDYWAGSLPGSRKCECGLLGDCFTTDKWCNCDSQHDDWLYDGGEIKEKEYLPVRALHFGDTGTPVDRKEGRFNLGPLECDGDLMFENMVTFRLSDGVIELPTFEMGLTSGDIFFEFKTSVGEDQKWAQPMVMLHSTGEMGDMIKVSLISGDAIQFEWAAGKGKQSLTVETTYRLDDNNWHSVLIEKNRKEAMVVIDGARKVTFDEPIGPVRPFKLTSKLYVGATKEYTDGYVGCLRALVLNGVAVDLVGEVTKHPWGMYGVGVGCVGKCARNPCMNGGTCLEGYSSFACDCRWTQWKGPICADEIGVNMKSESMIKYDFRGRYKSTLNERIHVGFTTTDPKGFLLGLYSDISREFLTLMVSNSGHIRLVFDFGFERQEIVFVEQNFMTGQYHDVLVERYDNGRKLRMTIDNYPPQEYDFSASLKTQADAQFNNIKYLYIGKNESMTEGFSGCISRVEFDEIIPLKLYFQEDPHGNIRSEPEIITEDFCGMEPTTLKPEAAETRRPPVIDEETLAEFYDTTSSIILGIVLSFIFFCLIIVCVCIGKYMNRHKGDYYTQEDEGARDAFDADTAVLQGRTGHQVQNKKEWFI